MLSNFFNIPFYLAISIAEGFELIFGAIVSIVFELFFDSNENVSLIGYFFFISVAISFIFVAIKFIRSFVWGS